MVKRVLSTEPGLGMYMAGDNIAESISCEDIGWVHRNQILGKVIWQSQRANVIAFRTERVAPLCFVVPTCCEPAIWLHPGFAPPTA